MKWVLRRENQFTFFLNRDKLHFVNRRDAVNELRKIHRQNYNRARDHSGAAFVIPLCDHVVGLGKSEFGRNYLRQCRAEMEGKPRSEFNEVLYGCHSVEIVFEPESLVDKDSMDHVIIKNCAANKQVCLKHHRSVLANRTKVLLICFLSLLWILGQF